MAYSYSQKLVVCGNHVEYYKYKKRVWTGFDVVDREPSPPKQLSLLRYKILKEKRRKDSLYRAKVNLRRLVNSNPQLNKFFTLTYSDNITDLSKSNRIFNNFVKRIRYYYPDFEYICVPEFQKRGAVHYHLLCNLPYVHYSVLEDIWSYGSIDICLVRNIHNVGVYLSKYLSKDFSDDRFFGKKRFFKSRSLFSPVILFMTHLTSFFNKFLLDIIPDLDVIYNSPYCGQVVYKVFKLNKIPFKNGFFHPSIISP